MNFYKASIYSLNKNEAFDLICSLFPTIVENNRNYTNTYTNAHNNRTINLGSLGMLFKTYEDSVVCDFESERIINHINDVFFSKKRLLFEGGCSKYIQKKETMSSNLLFMFWNGYVNSITKDNS